MGASVAGVAARAGNDPSSEGIDRRSLGPGGWLLCAGILGLVLGQWLQGPVWWLGAGLALPWGLALVGRRLGRERKWAWWGLMAGVICVHGGWAGLVMHWEDDRPNIKSFIQIPVGESGQESAAGGEGGARVMKGHITRVEGVVAGAVRHVPTDDGVFTDFAHSAPSTRLVLEVERVWTAVGPVRACGRVLMTTRGVDERLERGQRLGVRGWLLGGREGENPGDEMEGELGRYGLDGRLYVSRAGNVEVMTGEGENGVGWRDGLKVRADEALMRGIDAQSPAGRLTRALIIGTRDEGLYEISEPYRKTGLFHLLSISGAHLSILLGLVWLVGRVVSGNPAITVWVVLGVLGCYLLVLPEEVPIVRASIMVAGLCMGDLLGRRLGASVGLLASAWLILAVRPDEATNIGFQLSYAGVMALLWLTGRVDGFLKGMMSWRPGRAVAGPVMPVMPEPPASGFKREVMAAGRWLRLIVAADLAACLGTLPVLAYGLGTVNPLGWLWSLVSLPVVTAVLVAGFIKMILGLILPGMSLGLAGLVSWLAGMLNGFVGWAGEVAGTSASVAPVGVSWLIGAAVVLVALGAGSFEKRGVRLVLCLGVLGMWLAAGAWIKPGDGARRWDVPVKGARLEVGAVSVGSGSCLYARAWEENGKPGGVLVFDAGSSSFARVGKHRILPAFNALGITRIDTLVISHADLDHYSGVVDLADGMPIGRVVTTRYVVDDARDKTWGAEAVLIKELDKRKVPVFLVERGDTVSAGPGVEGEVLWPMAGLKGWATNDLSVVMKIKSGGKTVLFCGDVQEKSIEGLGKLEVDVKADIAELPHHGGVVKKSGQWLVDVRPEYVIQSSGSAKLVNEVWPQLLAITGSKRLSTARDGFVRIWVTREGSLVPESFKQAGAAVWGPEEEE
jgi:competence protein ComEC